MALLDQEDKVTTSVAEGFNELFKLLVDKLVLVEDCSQLVGTFPLDSRIILLPRVDTLDEAFLGLPVLALGDHDEAFVQAQLLLEDVNGDCKSALSEHLVVFTFEDHESTPCQGPAVVFI